MSYAPRLGGGACQSGLFKSIDFAAGNARLTALMHALDAATARIADLYADGKQTPDEVIAYLRVLDDYVSSLRRAADLLREVAASLEVKAAGGAGPSYGAHQERMRLYEAARAAYVAQGNELNEAFGRLSSG